MSVSWVGCRVADLDTPCLLIDLDRMEANIERTVAYASERGWRYRPHAKTHKIPAIAHRQLRAGAAGITVAKLGEAEVMAAAGIDDILIAHVIVGEHKLRRLAALARQVRLAVGVDHPEQARLLSQVFRHEARPLEIMIEVDTGHGRAGVLPGKPAVELAAYVRDLPGLRVRGIFTHEGHDYNAESREQLADIARQAQEAMARTGRAVAEAIGSECTVSIGSTPSLQAGVAVAGIHELRAGTSVFYDASQAQLLGHTDWCAATVLATIVSTPAPDRAVADAGAKALSSDRRTSGLLRTEGYGLIIGHPDLRIARLSDEHAVITGADAGRRFRIGDRIRIIPNHICPVVNLFDRAYGVRGDRVEVVWPVAARGCTQ